MKQNNTSGLSAEELALAGHRYQWLFHHSPNILAVLSPEGILLSLGDSVEKILGYTPGELTGKPLSDIVHPESHETIRTMVNGPGGKGIPDLFELQVRHKDGSRRFLEAAASDPVIEAGLSGILVTARDVTKRKELQDQLLRAQRLETIGSLAGGVAHDLNNILAPILMAIELLQRGITDKKKLNMLRIMESSAKKGRGIVKQVLTFARGSEGEQSLVQPGLLIKDAVDIVTQTFPPNITIEQKISPDCWTVRADSTQMHQVLMNLLVNARDAMADGGSITIAAENIAVDESYARMVPSTSPGSYVVLTVADTGAGIPPNQLRRIFDPFYTTKGVEKGTGLGLSTVKHIVESHKGAVAVESTVGKGTSFRLHLPATLSEESGSEAQFVAAPPAGNGEMIIIADDDESIRDITKQTLMAFGYAVRTASNGAEALALLIQEKDQARILFTDFAMPVMDGRQLINAIKKMNLGVKIVLASGTSTSEETKKLVGEDADAILSKPFTAGTLLTTIHDLLQADSAAAAKSLSVCAETP